MSRLRTRRRAIARLSRKARKAFFKPFSHLMTRFALRGFAHEKQKSRRDVREGFYHAYMLAEGVGTEEPKKGG